MPVTKLESSEARNTAALATSSGSPIRPIGMVDSTLERMRRSFQLHGPGSHQIANCRLGRAVGPEGRRAFDDLDGADENDRPSVVHQRQSLCTVNSVPFTLRS